MPVKYTEARIARMHKDGYGQGTGADYRPWIAVSDISSSGRSRRVWSPKTRRTHHLLSDVEYRLFLALEWSRDVTDIREQFPLDRVSTQAAAQRLGILHPCYPGTAVPVVMTTDFMITRLRNGIEVHEAFDAKRTEEAEDTRSLLKLEIARTVCGQQSITHNLVFDTLIPSATVKNIDWIRDAAPKEGETEPRPGYWSGLTARMAAELSGGEQDLGQPLARYCSFFDARHGVEAGSGLRTARMLMSERMIKVDLCEEQIEVLPLSSFVMTARPGQLRSVSNS